MNRIRRFLSILLVMTIILTGISLSFSVSAASLPGAAMGFAIFSGNSYPAQPSFSVRLQNVCILTGLSNVVNGSVHSNYNIDANTSFIIGAGEAVGTVTGDNILTKISGAPYVSMPDYSIYKTQIKAEAIAAGHYYSGNFSIANKASVNLNSPVYVEGSANLSGISFSGSGCLYAGGKISITGSATAYDSTSKISLYSGYASTSKSDAAINFSGSAKNYSGMLYAPNGSILVSGSNYTFSGNIIGRVVDVAGSNKTFYSSDISESFKYACSFLMTFNANGGSDDTSNTMAYGAALTAPTVTKAGYIFTGWSPMVPATVPAQNTTYTAQYNIKPSVSITKLAEGFNVNIKGWVDGYKYQIWSYQKITGDIFPADSANQWVLSKAYTLASAGALQPDGSINFFIEDFTSANSNYTVSVRIINSSNKFAGEIMDSYTSAQVQEVKITKVLVDGDYAKGMVIKEIDASTPLVFTVIGNNVANTIFTATVLESDSQPTSVGANEFSWDTSTAEPGIYTVKLTASNGATSDTKNVKVQLYSLNTGIQYGSISSLGLPEIADNILPKTVAITPSFSNGSFYYRVSEQGRTPIYTSGLFASTDNIEHTFNQFGTYFVQGFVNRTFEIRIGGNYDDGFFKTLVIARSKTEPSSATLASNVNIENPIAKGTPITFTANASIGGIGETPVQYSFWRYDAKGYALVKDWSSDNTLDWTPARVGIYTIEVRAKGEDAGSYEVSKSVKVTVNDDADQFAQGVVITLNEEELNANATARVPITIIASANSTNCEDLFYKFYVSDAAMGVTELQAYSINQECIWTPRKAGTYTISVLVKNGTSYGAYDAMGTFEITID